jgi:hypothetical protein
MVLKKNKIVVVSALFLMDKTVMDVSGPLDPIDGWDYILFTNDTSNLIESKIDPHWDIRPIECVFDYGVHMTKHVKWMTHEYLPDYDVVIWVDCFYSPHKTRLLEWEALIDTVTTDYNRPLMMRTQRFQSVSEDMAWCVKHNRVSTDTIQSTTDYLLSRGMDVYQNSRTYWSSVVIKNNKSSLLQTMSMDLMRLVTTISCRDQHWLPYLFHRHRITCDLFPKDLVACNGVQNRAAHSYEHIVPFPSTLQVFIHNYYSVHLEIIETLFTLFLPRLVGSRAACGRIIVYLQLVNMRETFARLNNTEYGSYITDKYDFVQLVSARPKNVSMDIEIYPTVYAHLSSTLRDGEKYCYIAHDVFDVFKPRPNVYFVTPLGDTNRFFHPLVLPPIVKRNTEIPVFAFQGRLDPKLKNLHSLVAVFKAFHDTPFLVKMIGKGDPLPFLDEVAGEKIVYERNLSFTSFHEAFSDVFALMPLVDETFSHPYFTTKLTSAMSYGRGYDLWIVCHSRLQEIYNLPRCFSYGSVDGFVDAFGQALAYFYSTPA